MSRQFISNTKKANDSSILAPNNLSQRIGIDRTDYSASTPDTPISLELRSDKSSHSGVKSKLIQNFTNIPVRTHSKTYPIQAKLKIGQPNDQYEQEADRVAEQVMRMPDPGLSTSVFNSARGGGAIQRACPSCSKEHKVVEDSEEGLIQANQITPLIQEKTSTDVAPEVTSEIGSGIQSLQGRGQPMSKSERSFFEPRFGADFSGVRVHNDARAASVARSVGARAFTLGSDVVFGGGGVFFEFGR